MQPEFSRIVKLEDIPKNGFKQNLEASPKECAALAKRMSLGAITSLEAQVELEWKGDNLLSLTLNFTSDIEQACVRTMEPLKGKLTCHVQEELTTNPLPFQDEEMDLETLMATPESIEGDEIDLGEIIAQHLSLEIDPFASDNKAGLVDHVEDEVKTPFEKLKDLTED